MNELVLYQNQDGLARLTLNRPERHNALVPELLDALADALARAHGEAPRALLLDANGRSFSTGGDVAGFYHTPWPDRAPASRPGTRWWATARTAAGPL